MFFSDFFFYHLSKKKKNLDHFFVSPVFSNYSIAYVLSERTYMSIFFLNISFKKKKKKKSQQKVVPPVSLLSMQISTLYHSHKIHVILKKKK